MRHAPNLRELHRSYSQWAECRGYKWGLGAGVCTPDGTLPPLLDPGQVVTSVLCCVCKQTLSAASEHLSEFSLLTAANNLYSVFPGGSSSHCPHRISPSAWPSTKQSVRRGPGRGTVVTSTTNTTLARGLSPSYHRQHFQSTFSSQVQDCVLVAKMSK